MAGDAAGDGMAQAEAQQPAALRLPNATLSVILSVIKIQTVTRGKLQTLHSPNQHPPPLLKARPFSILSYPQEGREKMLFNSILHIWKPDSACRVASLG